MRAAERSGGTLHHHGSRTLQPQPERRRGIRNFLTWAFFLAQAGAAEILLTGAAKAYSDDMQDGTGRASEQHVDQPPADDAHSRIESSELPSVDTPATSYAIGSHLASYGHGPAGSAHALPLTGVSSATHGALGGAHAAGAASLAVGGVAPAAHHAHVGSAASFDDMPPLLSDLAPAGLDIPGTGGISIELTPLLGFDVKIETGGAIVGVGLDLNHLVIDPLETVTSAVSSVGDELGNLLETDVLGLGDLVHASTLSLGELTGLNLSGGIAGLVDFNLGDASVGPSEGHHGSNAASDPTAAALVTITDDFSASDVVGDGGIIRFDAGPVTANVDPLYAAGQHTDYGIALKDTSASNNNNNDAALIPIEPVDDHAGQVPPSADHPHIDPAAGGPLHLDDFALRAIV